MTAHNGIRFTILVLYLPYQYMRYEYDSKLIELFKIVIFIISKRQIVKTKRFFYVPILYDYFVYLSLISTTAVFFGIMNEYNYFTVDVNDDMINVFHTTMVACQIAAMYR